MKSNSSIPECPAYDRCKAIKADCGVCLELSPDAWREHVRKILAKEAV